MTAAAAPPPRRDPGPADAGQEDGLLLASALVGTLAMEASLITQALQALQGQLGDMLGPVALRDEDMRRLQGLDELTQRVADLSAILEAAGREMDTRDRITVAPLTRAARLAHSRALVAGLDLTRSHDRPLGEHGDPGAAEPVTFF